MAHRTESTHNLSGHFSDDSPATNVQAADVEQFQEHLCKAAEKAGLTLKTVATEDHNQLWEMIRILAGRVPATGAKGGFSVAENYPVDAATGGYTLSANPQTLSSLSMMNVLIGESGINAVVNLPSDAAYNGKIFFFINVTGSAKVVAGYSLENNAVAIFFTAAAGIWEALVGKVTTDGLAEGSTHLYWTDGRFAAALAASSTTNLPEGTHLYYTDGRAAAVFAAGFAAAFAAAFAAETLDALPDGTTRMAVFKDSGTFTIALKDGSTTLDSGTAHWKIVDEFVELSLPDLSGTGAGGSMTLDGLPADIYSAGVGSTTWGPICFLNATKKVGLFRVVGGSVIDLSENSTNAVTYEVYPQILRWRIA